MQQKIEDIAINNLDSYTEEQQKEYYEGFIEEATENMDLLMALRVNYEYSDYFDTEMRNRIEKTKVYGTINEYVRKHGGWGEVGDEFTEEQNEIIISLNKEMNRHSRVIYIAIKRSIDFIRRSGNITSDLNKFMLNTLINDGKPTKTALKNFSINKIGKTYQYTQLDLTTLKAIAYTLPLPEAFSIINHYEKELDDTIKRWNDMQDTLKIGKFKETFLNSSEKLFKENYNQIETRELLLKNIDGYATQFMNHVKIKNDIIIGDAYDE